MKGQRQMELRTSSGFKRFKRFWWDSKMTLRWHFSTFFAIKPKHKIKDGVIIRGIFYGHSSVTIVTIYSFVTTLAWNSNSFGSCVGIKKYSIAQSWRPICIEILTKTIHIWYASCNVMGRITQFNQNCNKYRHGCTTLSKPSVMQSDQHR